MLKRLLFMIVFASLVFIFLPRIQAAADSPQATPTSLPISKEEKFYIPLIFLGAGETQNLVNSTITAMQENAEQPILRSDTLQISFSIPGGWSVEPVLSNGKKFAGDVISLRPVNRKEIPNSKIEITIQSFEIDPSQSLLDWQQDMLKLNYAVNAVFEASDFVLQEISSQALQDQFDSKNVAQIEMVNNKTHSTTQLVLIRHGRLVYIINSIEFDKSMQPVLDALALSVRFAEQAPNTLKELFGVDQSFPSISEVIKTLQLHQGEIECDIVCRDEKESGIVIPKQPGKADPNFDPQYSDFERKYLEERQSNEEWQRQERELPPNPTINASSIQVSGQQKALPPNWTTPIATTTSVNVNCGSTLYTGNAEFAVDIAVGIGTTVYAAQAGDVVASYYDSSGYGNLVLISTLLSTAAENRAYYHAYAHLNSRSVVVNNSVARGSVVGYSGQTGTNGGPHLHFHIRDADNKPVDASPIIGFVPNLNYPSVSSVCGQIKPMNSSPIIIEPVAFAIRNQPLPDEIGQNHWWFCYTGGQINECHMDIVPNPNGGFNIWNTLYNPQSPRLGYYTYLPQTTSYRLWVCANGGTVNDDTLHMGFDNTAYSTSIIMAGYDANAWQWRSIRIGGNSIPSISTSAGHHYIDVWMREDGLKINRILLTPDFAYSPSQIRCGSY